MTLDIQSLKSEYIKYMKAKGKPVENGEVDIFSTSFRNFLSTQDGIDVNRMGLSIQDLVDTLDESENTDVMAALEDAKDSFDSEDASNVIDFLSIMMEDEEFASKIDADGKNGVDKSELVTFLSSISREDKDSKDITLRDLIDGGKEVANGNFEMPEVKDWDEIVEKKGSKKTEETESTSGASSAGGTSSAGSSGNATANNATTNNEQKEINAIQEAAKSYEGKTVAELEQEKTTQQANFDEQNQIMQDAIAGNSAQVAAQKTAMDNAYQAFLDTCTGEEELTQQAETQRQQLQETEVQYNQAYVNKEDLSMQQQGVEMQIASVSESITALDTQISSLQTALSSVQAAANSGSAEQKSTYASQAAALQSQIQQATQQKTELNNQKTELETEQENLKTQIEELETSLEELKTTYEEQSQALQETETALISTSEAAAQAYADYDSAKTTYETANDEIRNNARVATQTARANLEAIDNQLIIAKREEREASFMQFATDFDNGKYDTYTPSESDSSIDSNPTTASPTSDDKKQNEDDDENEEDK